MKEIDTHKEAISAMLDDELRAGECERCATLIREHAELRETWDTYSLIGDLMRGTPASFLPRGLTDRIKAEPTVLAPRALHAHRRVVRYALPAAAAAAGIGFVTWISLGLLPGQNAEITTADARPPAATAPAAAVVPVRDNGVMEDYLLAHQPYSLTSPMQGVAPYVRPVSDQSESAKQ